MDINNSHQSPIDESIRNQIDPDIQNDDQSDKIAITRIYCIKELRAKNSNKKYAAAFGSVLLILAEVFIIWGSFYFEDMLDSGIIASIFVLPLFVACMILFVKSLNLIKKIDSMNFFIAIDKCANKYIISDDDSSSERKVLQFNKYGKHIVDFKHTGIVTAFFFEAMIYDKTNQGDEFYVLLVDGDKKISFAFPKSQFYIPENEFIYKNDKIIPIRDVNADTLYSNEKEKQLQQMSVSERDIIQNAQEIINIAKKRTKVVIFISLVGLILMISGTFLYEIAFINMLILPFVHIIPEIRSLIAVRKSKVSFDKVPMSYVNYHEMHNAQNFGLIAALLSMINILVYILNFAILLSSII